MIPLNDRRKLLAQLGGTALVIAAVLRLGTSTFFVHGAMAAPFRAEALVSIALLLFVVPCILRNVTIAAAVVVVLGVFDFVVMHVPVGVHAIFALVGIGSLAALAIAALWAEFDERKILLVALVPALLFAAADWLITFALYWTGILHPKTLDLFVFSFDASLGVQPSFVVGQWFSALPWLRMCSMAAYLGLPAAMMVPYAARLRQRDPSAVSVMVSFAAAGIGGLLLYNVLPAVGPIYVFSGFPYHPLTTEAAAQLQIRPLAVQFAPRNAIPSLHMTWALLAYWTSRSLSGTLRAFLLVVVAFTVLATLGTGEHYLADLVVAAPFALAIYAGCCCRETSQRRNALLFGTFLTLVWILALSFATPLFWFSAVVPYAMITATLIAVALMLQKLHTQPLAGRSDLTSDLPLSTEKAVVS